MVLLYFVLFEGHPSGAQGSLLAMIWATQDVQNQPHIHLAHYILSPASTTHFLISLPSGCESTQVWEPVVWLCFKRGRVRPACLSNMRFDKLISDRKLALRQESKCI